ncbi:MAG: hypothetical protein U0871_10485 [Gemmataceae bacterium]
MAAGRSPAGAAVLGGRGRAGTPTWGAARPGCRPNGPAGPDGVRFELRYRLPAGGVMPTAAVNSPPPDLPGGPDVRARWAVARELRAGRLPGHR